VTLTEALDGLLPRVAHLQEGLGQWQELVECLTAAGRPLDPGSTEFVLWAMRSFARSLVAIDGQVDELLAAAPEIPGVTATDTRLELVRPTITPGARSST
jgi:hypothetical protein